MALALAVAPMLAQQVGEGIREALARREAERVRSRERWETLIAEARAERGRP